MYLPWPGVPLDVSLGLVALFAFSLETNPSSAVRLQVFVCQCVTCPLLSFHEVFSRAETFDFTQSAGLPFCALPFCIVCEDSKLMPKLRSRFFWICETVGTENRSQENLKRIWCKVSSFHPHSCHPLHFQFIAPAHFWRPRGWFGCISVWISAL